MPENDAKGWVAALGEQIAKHGFATVVASVLVGVLCYMGWSIAEELKEQQRYNREKVGALAEKSIEVTTKAVEVIEQSTDQSEKVEKSIDASTRMLGRVLKRLPDDEQEAEQ